jgi:hypothetical protein
MVVSTADDKIVVEVAQHFNRNRLGVNANCTLYNHMLIQPESVA